MTIIAATLEADETADLGPAPQASPTPGLDDPAQQQGRVRTSSCSRCSSSSRCSPPSSRRATPGVRRAARAAAVGRALARHHRERSGRLRADGLGRSPVALRRLLRRRRRDPRRPARRPGGRLLRHGAIDEVLSLVTNVFLLLPGLPLLVVLAAFLPPGPATVIIVLVITGWAGSARVLRSQAMSIRAKDFVAASVVTGERPGRIMFREILPNMASIVMSTLLACVIFGIGAQAGLEFLGLGDPSAVSWGTNLYWAIERRRAAHRGMVGVRAVGRVHRARRVRPRHGQLRGRRGHEPSAPSTPEEGIPMITTVPERRAPGRAAAAPLPQPRRADAMQRPPLLEVRDVRIEYQTDGAPFVAADGVSFTIHEGEIFGLAGESGSGKSTIANAILAAARRRRLGRGRAGDRSRTATCSRSTARNCAPSGGVRSRWSSSRP